MNLDGKSAIKMARGLWRVLPARRAYKVVILDDATQSVIEMRDREPPANQLTAP
jgi:hypothetical protein